MKLTHGMLYQRNASFSNDCEIEFSLNSQFKCVNLVLMMIPMNNILYGVLLVQTSNSMFDDKLSSFFCLYYRSYFIPNVATEAKPKFDRIMVFLFFVIFCCWFLCTENQYKCSYKHVFHMMATEYSSLLFSFSLLCALCYELSAYRKTKSTYNAIHKPMRKH